LRALGLSPKKAVTVIYVESAVVAVLGLFVTFAPPELTVAVAVAGAAILLFIMVYGLRWLEYHEFLEAGASLTSAARQARWVIQDKINARDLATLIRKADSFESLSSIIEESAPTFRFSHMELRHGALSRHLPPHIAGELHTARFCKLEYPVAQRVPKPNDFVTLNIWCTTEALRRRVGAERVARIIAPAIAGWLDVGHVPQPAPAPAMPITAPATLSGAQGERERPRRAARPGHSMETERAAGMAMAAKPQSRGDELRN
jgi:hypothetical protein